MNDTPDNNNQNNAPKIDRHEEFDLRYNNAINQALKLDEKKANTFIAILSMAKDLTENASKKNNGYYFDHCLEFEEAIDQVMQMTLKLLPARQKIWIFSRVPIDCGVFVMEGSSLCNAMTKKQYIEITIDQWVEVYNNVGSRAYWIQHTLNQPLSREKPLTWRFDFGSNEKNKFIEWANETQNNNSKMWLDNGNNTIYQGFGVPDYDRDSWLDNGTKVSSILQGTCHWIEFI